MDDHKRLWFQAYCAALQGMLASPTFEGDDKLLGASKSYADAALSDYRDRFGSDAPTDAPYEGWAHLEIMGHRSHYGYVREVMAYGTRMIEIQELDQAGEGFEATFMYGGGAIFCNTPMDEETCRHLARGEHKMTCDHTDKTTGKRCGVPIWSLRSWDYCPEHAGDREHDTELPFDRSSEPADPDPPDKEDVADDSDEPI